MANKPSEVTADSNVRGNNVVDINLSAANAKSSLRSVTESYELFKAEQEAIEADVKALGVTAIEAAKQLIRPTPGMFRAISGVVRQYTAVIREVRGYIGSVTVAMPALAMALSEARDKAGAFTFEVMDQAANELAEEETKNRSKKSKKAQVSE
jgi:hypothetical protein